MASGSYLDDCYAISETTVIEGVSPAVVSYIEKRYGEFLISVNKSVDADNCCFLFSNGSSVLLEMSYIEQLEIEARGQGLLSRELFDNLYGAPSSGTLQGRSANFFIIDESGEIPEFDIPESKENKFCRSLKKVYWYRYLKNKLK